MIRVFVTFAVALGIASVLVVSVVQRQREIGILRAMGTPAWRILGCFIARGGIVGLVGAYLAPGWAPGWRWALPRLPAPKTAGRCFRWCWISELFASGTALIAFVVGLLSALMPALRAARLDPVEAIRG